MKPQGEDERPARRWFRRSHLFERRKAKRQEIPELVAYYWDGDAPQARQVRNASSSGLYLLTDQRWYPGTLVTMTLQKSDIVGAESGRSLSVQTKVVRHGTDGAGVAFIRPLDQKEGQRQSSGSYVAEQKTIEEFLQRLLEK